MTTNAPDNVLKFRGPQNSEQDVDPHRDVIVSLTQIIRQMSGLVNAINEGPTTVVDKAKFASMLCSASALCLRAQLQYFDQFIGDHERISDAPSFESPLSPGPST